MNPGWGRRRELAEGAARRAVLLGVGSGAQVTRPLRVEMGISGGDNP